MSTSTSQDSSSMNTERAVGTDEWILPNPVIDNPIYYFFEEQVPHNIPIFDTEDHTYTDLIDSSCLPESVKWSGAILREDEVSKFIMELEAQNDMAESPTKHDLDAASATPPLPEASTDANAGLPQNDKRGSPTKHDKDAASATPPPPVAATQAKQLIHYVSAQQVIVVETGEDVAEKIISFAKGGPRAVSIRSATGKVTKVVLKRRSTSSVIETHEGLYNIVSLRGSVSSIEVEGKRRLTGGLHISLAADGRASFGGLVKGALTAASQVEVTVMSMTAKGKEDS